MLDILVVGVTVQRGAAVPALGSDATQGLDEMAPSPASAPCSSPATIARRNMLPLLLP